MGFEPTVLLPNEVICQAEPRPDVRYSIAPASDFLKPKSSAFSPQCFFSGVKKESRIEQRDLVLAEIDTQIETGFFRLVDASQSSIYAKAQELSNKHTPAVATRSLDLMHLAAALLSGARTFLTFDKRQAKAAFAEGLLVKP